MWQQLFANIAVGVLSLLAWNALGDRVWRLGPLRARLLFGLAIGLGAVGSMAMAYEVRPGMFYDARGPLIALAAFFGGWPAALVSATAAFLFRIHLGGAVLLGSLSIVLATGAGLGVRALAGKRSPAMPHLLGLAAAVACCRLPMILAMPAEARAAVLSHQGGMMLLSFATTFFFGTALLQESRRRELARANQLYRSMVDALPDCLNIKDAQGRFLAANPATARLMQAPSAQALIGKTDFDFYPPEIAARFQADEAAAMSSGSYRTIEQRGIMADNSAGWLATLKTPVRDENGTVVGVVTHNRDITTAKEIQARLSRTQAYLDQALESMSDGLAMFDPDGTLLFCNPRYREFFSVTSHLRVPGSRFGDILRASVALGEADLPDGMSVEAYVADRLSGLKQNAERAIALKSGRTLAGRTTVLPDGAALVVVSDVTERVNFEKHLHHQALHDPLTGLPNRACFNRDFSRALAHARAEGSELMVMLLDLDHFKEVNDTHGHAAGDALLVEVSRRLEAAVRPGDVVARLGGDEFALLAPAAKGSLNDAAFAARLMKALSAPMTVGETVLIPGATIGYTLASQDPSDAGGLLKNADRALYQAKFRRRGSWKLWTPPTEPAALAG